MLRLASIYQPCNRDQAGVARIFVTENDGIGDVGFNREGQVSSLALKAGYTLKQVDFDTQLATLSQQMQRSAAYPVIEQEISFVHQGSDNEIVNAIMAMALQCNIGVLAELNTGKIIVLGLNVFVEAGNYYEAVGMELESGSMNAGKPTQGGHELEHTLTAVVNRYAPEFVGDISTLPIDIIEPPVPPDVIAPDVIEYTPAPGSLSVVQSPVIAMRFSEAIVPGAGSLELRRYDDDTVVQNWATGSPAVVIDPMNYRVDLLHGLTLDFDTKYYLSLPAGAFQDGSGNVNAANDKDDATFTVLGQEAVTPPEVIALTPADGTSGVPVPFGELEVSVQFDKDVIEGVGQFLIYKGDTTSPPVATAAAGSGEVTVTGDTATITFSFEIEESTTYTVIAEAGVVADTFGNDFAGILDPTEWNFETGLNAYPRVEGVAWQDGGLSVALPNIPQANYISTVAEGASVIEVFTYVDLSTNFGETLVATLVPGEAFIPAADQAGLYAQFHYTPVDVNGLAGPTVLSPRVEVEEIVLPEATNVRFDRDAQAQTQASQPIVLTPIADYASQAETAEGASTWQVFLYDDAAGTTNKTAIGSGVAGDTITIGAQATGAYAAAKWVQIEWVPVDANGIAGNKVLSEVFPLLLDDLLEFFHYGDAIDIETWPGAYLQIDYGDESFEVVDISGTDRVIVNRTGLSTGKKVVRIRGPVSVLTMYVDDIGRPGGFDKKRIVVEPAVETGFDYTIESEID